MPSAAITFPANSIITKSSIEKPLTDLSLQGLFLGETIDATVLEKSAGNKYLLALKNLQIPATSNVPLTVGEKLVVKVDSLQPQVVLNITGNKNQNSNAKINENLLKWRANPEALVQVIDKVAGFAKLLKNFDLPYAFPKTDADKLMKLFDNIIFSPQTKNDPLFLKEYVSRIGLLMENSLKQQVAPFSKGRIERPPEDNLKALLLKLSSSVSDFLRETPKLDADIRAKLVSISAFTDEALKTIEVKQTINSVFQDSDNGLILQVPMALADGFRLADIFITPEGTDGRGKLNFSSCTVSVFLDLDVLGKIAVNANFHEGVMNCIIKCEIEEVRDLIDNHLDELKKALVETGYRIGYLDCIQEEGLMQKREEFLAGQSFFADQLVNFFV